MVILGGLIVSSCATTQSISYTYPVPSEQDIEKYIYEWNDLERTKGPVKTEFTFQYSKLLKALSDSIAETERWRNRAENK